MFRTENRLSTNFTKMSSHWKFSLNLIIILFIVLAKTANGSPAPPYLPIMTSHSENLDIVNSKMLPAGTYPNYAAAALAAATFNDTELNPNKKHDLVKRSWEKLHGSWGKRSYDKNNYDRNNYDTDYNSNMESFNAANNILSESKEDDFIDDGNQDYKDLLKYSEVYRWSPNSVNNLLDQEPLYQVKRGWKNMNTAWGKRRSNNNDWNKFRGSWGKRETGWNSLRGMWGKRAGDWNKLQAAWGKRSFSNDDLN